MNSVPPASVTQILPSWKKPMNRESGDQNADEALTVSGISTASKESSERRNNRRSGAVAFLESAEHNPCRPSGEIAPSPAKRYEEPDDGIENASVRARGAQAGDSAWRRTSPESGEP